MKRKQPQPPKSQIRPCPHQLLTRVRGGSISTFDPDADVVLDAVLPHPIRDYALS